MQRDVKSVAELHLFLKHIRKDDIMLFPFISRKRAIEEIDKLIEDSRNRQYIHKASFNQNRNIHIYDLEQEIRGLNRIRYYLVYGKHYKKLMN